MGPTEPIVILGPTATGKSELAILCAIRLGGRVISADSVLVYRGLDIGSCKPTAEARRGIPHDLIDVADPTEPFSAGTFARRASAAIAAARERGERAIVAGGTGLYLRALLDGIASMPPRDEAIRGALYARAAGTGPGALHRELSVRDPEAAARIGPNDLQRIVRALEVSMLTGTPLTGHIRRQAFRPGRMPALRAGLTMDRDALYRRIEARVDRIFREGLVEEVRRLLAAGVPPAAHALKALGYREVVAHLRGGPDLSRTIDLVKRNTRRYARRQILWFRREPDIHWFDTGRQTLDEIADRIAGMAAAPGS